MREILLVRYGEVFLKGQNRPFFLRKLVDHVKFAVKDVQGRVWLSDGRIYVSDYTDQDEAIRRISRVFGVHSVSPAIEMEKDTQLEDNAKPLVATLRTKQRGAHSVLIERIKRLEGIVHLEEL